MNIQLLDVDEGNWRECIELTVAEAEKSFVDSNMFAIAEWKFEPENKIRAIYSQCGLVGMLAYYFHDGRYGKFYWLYHLMIDVKHQGKGHGQAAVRLALQEVRELGAKEIVTNCAPKNARALSLYKRLGFEENGTLEGGDIFLRKPELDSVGL